MILKGVYPLDVSGAAKNPHLLIAVSLGKVGRVILKP
jgi:hypothetical protein